MHAPAPRLKMRPADSNVVSFKELRFKPANSNDAARAVYAHQFKDVPRCSFAKDDGISQYMGAETGMATFPSAPGDHVALHDDVPNVASEAQAKNAGLGHKLLRSGFAMSVFLHAVAAL